MDVKCYARKIKTKQNSHVKLEIEKMNRKMYEKLIKAAVTIPVLKCSDTVTNCN